MEADKRFIVCRLCLCTSEMLTGVFEYQDGYTPAEIITELLRFEVSMGDMYPQCVCGGCMGKLKDFKIFKERCIAFKASIDHAYAAKCVSIPEPEPYPVKLNPVPCKIEKILQHGDGIECIQASCEGAQGILTAEEAEMIIPDVPIDLQTISSGDLDDKDTSMVEKMEITVPLDIPSTQIKEESEHVQQGLQVSEDIRGNGNASNPLSSQAISTAKDVEEASSPQPCDGAEEPENIQKVTRSMVAGPIPQTKETNTFHDGSDDISKDGFSEGELDDSSPGFNSDEIDSDSSDSDLDDEFKLPGVKKNKVKKENVSQRDIPCTSGTSNSANKAINSSLVDHIPKVVRGVIKNMEEKPLTEANRSGVSGNQDGDSSSSTSDSDSEDSEWDSDDRADGGSKKNKGPFNIENDLLDYSHFTATRGVKNLECPQCGKRYADKRRLRDHINEHKYGRRFKCATCGKCFGTKRYLQSHLMVHDQGRDSVCEICGKAFKNKDHLNIHKKIHGEKKFICDMCGKKFTTLNRLKSHQSYHNRDKTHACEQCGKLFHHPKLLQSHLQVHNGKREGRHICDECGLKCFSPAALRTHFMRVHSGERPYKCSLCEKDFTGKDSLERHMNTHTREQQYKCDICDAMFYSTTSLYRHRKRHSGAKDYKCDVCGKEYTQGHNLKNHKKKHLEN